MVSHLITSPLQTWLQVMDHLWIISDIRVHKCTLRARHSAVRVFVRFELSLGETVPSCVQAHFLQP